MNSMWLFEVQYYNIGLNFNNREGLMHNLRIKIAFRLTDNSLTFLIKVQSTLSHFVSAQFTA